MNIIYRLRNIAVRYQRRTALSIDYLELRRGRLYTLLGHNGAGKSTLLHLLSLLNLPDKGSMEVMGADLPMTRSGRQSLMQGITLVHQHPYLLRGTVDRNLRFGMRLRGIPAAEQDRRIDEVLGRFGLEGFAHRKAQGLSGGERQRVALARAILLEPKVLLLDEPTAGLDNAGIPLFKELLRGCLAKGTTIILSTHDREFARRMGGETITLEGGRISGNLPCTTPPMEVPCQSPLTSADL